MTIRLLPSEQVWDSQYPRLGWPDQHLVYPNRYTEYEEREKLIPVPLGNFTPGVFRIQPYYVMRRTLFGSRSRCESVSNRGTATETRRQYYGKFCCNDTVSAVCKAANIVDLTSQRMLALQRAYGKIGQPDLQLGPELGELRETISMLKSPLRSLRDFLEHPSNFEKLRRLDTLRRFRHTRSGATFKVASDTWLEFRYGIRPLIETIKSIMEYALGALKKLLASHRILTVRSRWGDSPSAKWDCGSIVNYVPVKHTVNISDTLRVEGIVYFRMKYEQPGSAKLGLDPVNIPEILWELTRLSFVVDWLFSIGPWLESFRLTPHIEILGSTTSYKKTRVCTIRGTCAVEDVTVSDAGQAEYTEQVFQRFTHTSQPLTPIFRGGSGLSLAKAVDSVALILQPLLKKLTTKK